MGVAKKKKIASDREKKIERTAEADLDIIGKDVVTVFLLHRRVMTDLYKRFDLNGYEIEVLLLVCRECRYDVDTVVEGGTIRKRLSRRANGMIKLLIDKLVSRDYLEHAIAKEKMSHYRLRITTNGLRFLREFQDSIARQWAMDGVELIISKRMSFEKRVKES